MKPEFNNQQSDWLNQAEELNDVEAAQVNGGSSTTDLVSRANSLYSQVAAANIAFQEATASAKVAKDQSGKVQA